MAAIVLTRLEDWHDVPMVKAGRRLGFEVEPHHLIVCGQLPVMDHLDGDRTVEPDLRALRQYPCPAPEMPGDS